MNFEEACKIVENSIYGLRVDPQAARGDKPGKWGLIIKGANVWIDVFNFETNPSENYVQVMSPLFKVDTTHQLDIQNDLLIYAYSMYGCSVCRKNEWYYVLVLREAEGLDQSEIDRAIDRVGYYSHDIYSKFTFKYPSLATERK